MIAKRWKEVKGYIRRGSKTPRVFFNMLKKMAGPISDPETWTFDSLISGGKSKETEKCSVRPRNNSVASAQ
jgi:hypothetical protein